MNVLLDHPSVAKTELIELYIAVCILVTYLLSTSYRYNVAKVSISFEDLNYEVVYQTPRYTVSSIK